VIGKIISHYKILEKLGEGGMGVVYRAEDLKLTRTVALKFLPEGLHAHEPERTRFLQEARAAAILNQANICTVYDIQEHDGQQYIVMEYVDGRTLREIVPVKNMQDAIGYAVQIAEALQEAHTHGIVHRDVKADNIMVNMKNQVKVMDFGLAKLKGSIKLTKTSSTVGTLSYMAPEQIQGGDVDARSDIFSFGIVLYEMLTGRLPFGGEHEAAIMYAIVNEEAEPLQHYIPDAPSELLHILDRALEKDREERYQTVHEMLIDLRRLKKDSTRVVRQAQHNAQAPGVQPTEPLAAGKPKRRKTLWIASAGAAVLCVAAAVLFFVSPHPARLNPNRTSVALSFPFKEISWHSLSRDGNWVAFPAVDEGGKWNVYMMNTAGGTYSRITDESTLYLNGVDIAPDVSRIAYSCLYRVGGAYNVKVASSQGGGSRTVADTGIVPHWTPDGQRIGYMRGYLAPSASGRVEIWSVRPDGSDRRLEFRDTLTPFAETTQFAPTAFCWSPDGRSIAWVHNYPQGYGEVMVHDLATGRERQLTFDRKVVDEPIWAVNDVILFISNRSGQCNLWMLPAGGGEPTQVTQGGVPILGARISADKNTLVYLQQENVNHIWISSIDGGNARRATIEDAQPFRPRFSPDGKHIAYCLSGVDLYDQEAHLFVMDRDGKNRRQLTSGSEVVRGCTWSPDGLWLAYFSRAIGESDDSIRTFLIQPFDPGAPRVLSHVKGMTWVDSEHFVTYRGNRTLLYSINGGDGVQIFRDSTFAIPIQGNRRIMFTDNRRGKEGWWLVSIDALGKQEGEAKRIVPPNTGTAVPFDRRFMIYVDNRTNELWRVWTNTGKEERVGKAPFAGSPESVSGDGKEILWVRTDNREKLVLVRNVFE